MTRAAPSPLPAASPLPPPPPAGAAAEPAFRLGHRPALDGLRGAAILLVLWYHLPKPLGLRGGFLGVDLFFALSGFLITALMLEEQAARGSLDLLRFYARRALRLFPALAVFLAGYLLVAWLWLPDFAAHVRAALYAGLYVSNWVRAFEPPGGGPDQRAMQWLGHTWSLSIEEQFYLLWPAGFLLLVRFVGVRPAACWAVVGLAIACWGWRCWLLAAGAPPARTYNGLDVRADTLLVGCTLALALYGRAICPDGPRVARWLPGLTAAAVGVLAVSAVVGRYEKPLTIAVGYTLPAMAGAVLILAVLAGPHSGLARGLSARPLVWLGRLSYGIYLWHYPVFRLLEHHLFKGWALPPGLRASLALAAVGVPASLALAALSYYLVERPLLKLKAKLRRV